MPLADNFERHGREHVSASQITKFIASPAAWVETYLENTHRALGLRGFEGKVVEHALTLAFDKMAERNVGAEIDVVSLQHDMQVEAEIHFAKQMAEMDEISKSHYQLGFHQQALALEEMYSKANRDASIERICKKVEVGIPACIELFDNHGGKPESQVEVRWPIQLDRKSTIPVLGYIDWLFPDGHIVDLKTTRNIPSSLSLAHGLQSYVYMEAQKAREMEFMFIGDRKREPVLSLLVERGSEIYASSGWLLRVATVRLGRMLRLSKTTLSGFLVKDPGSFYFNTPPINNIINERTDNADHETSF